MKRATNAALMRIKNEKIILSLINKGPVSRADIAKKTGLTKAAVTIIVDDLKQRGIVTEKNGKSDSVGRNPVMLYLDSDAFYFVGINITRYNIGVGITDLSGAVIAEELFCVVPPDKATIKIKKIIEELILKSGIDRRKIYKISIVSPGPVDREKGIILNPPNFKEWHGAHIVEETERLIGIKTMLENVSVATAIAEKYFGASRNTENFLALLVDEGIGSGIMLNDALFKGSCELGHASIKFDGELCECGNCGCLEKYASIPHILEGTGYKNWQEAVDSGDWKLLEEEAQYLSTAIISANNIFNFDKIVLCGDLTYKPEKIIELISDKTKKNTLSRDSLEICSGQVKSKYLIASAVAIHDLLT